MDSRKFAGHNRRGFPRLDVNIAVVYDIRRPLIIRMLIGDKPIEAKMLNISPGGVSLLTDYDITPDTLLTLRFALSRLDGHAHLDVLNPMEISAEVRYCIPQKPDKYRLGIAFLDINEKDRAAIENFINTALSPGPII
jgi:c-di-GMP-binding flagellar brake protein YcgR